MDTDKDGTVTYQEFVSRLQAASNRPTMMGGAGGAMAAGVAAGPFPLAPLADPAAAQALLARLQANDIRGIGMLPPQMVHAALQQAGVPLSFPQFQEMLRRLQVPLGQAVPYRRLVLALHKYAATKVAQMGGGVGGVGMGATGFGASMMGGGLGVGAPSMTQAWGPTGGVGVGVAVPAMEVDESSLPADPRMLRVKAVDLLRQNAAYARELATLDVGFFDEVGNAVVCACARVCVCVCVCRAACLVCMHFDPRSRRDPLRSLFFP